MHRLREYAETDEELAGALQDANFEEAPVRFLVELADDGRFLGLIDRRGAEKRSPALRIPKVGARTVAPVPNLAVDFSGYVLGPDPAMSDAERRKTANQHQTFRALLKTAVEQSGDLGLRACAAFYDDAASIERLHDQLQEKKAEAPDRLAFALQEDNGRPVCQRPASVAFWNAHAAARLAARAAKGAAPARGKKAAALEPATSRCLICGEVKPFADRHMTKIMGVPDGQPAGTSLVSFNERAFESYGWANASNSPTCTDCVEAYSRALNKLLRRSNAPRTRYDSAGVAVLYWTIGGDALDLAAELLDQPDPDRVRELLSAAQRGAAPAAGLDAIRFCTLAMQGAGGRIMVREWLDTTIGAVEAALGRWFADLNVVTWRDQRRGGETVRRAGDRAMPQGIRNLLDALAGPGSDPPAHLLPGLLRAALTGAPLPVAAMAGAVHRQTAELGGNDMWNTPARMALIRATLNRRPEAKGERPMSEGLDEGQRSPGYLCGRLLAVLEGVQYAAVGDVGADIVDRFYGRAASAPVSAFPILMRLAQSHLRTLKRDKPGLAVTLEREIQQIASGLPASSSFPAFLPLEEQGRFALGFYHQKAVRFTRQPAADPVAAVTT